jgi:fatty acid amide hydrolase
MNILAAPGLNTLDPSVPPVPWPDPDDVSLAGLRIGMYTDNGLFSVAPAIRRAVKQAAQILRIRGVIIESWNPPDVSEAVRIFVGLRTADGFAGYRRLLGDDPLDPRIAAALQSFGEALTVDQYWQLVEAGNQYRQRFMTALEVRRLDALLCPPYGLPAPPHGSSSALNVTNAGSYAVLYNLLGFPAGVAPITRVLPGEESERRVGEDTVERAARAVEMNSAGLPTGVQVVARPWREDIVLALLAALEEDTSVGLPGWESSQSESNGR